MCCRNSKGFKLLSKAKRKKQYDNSLKRKIIKDIMGNHVNYFFCSFFFPPSSLPLPPHSKSHTSHPPLLLLTHSPHLTSLLFTFPLFLYASRGLRGLFRSLHHLRQNQNQPPKLSKSCCFCCLSTLPVSFRLGSEKGKWEVFKVYMKENLCSFFFQVTIFRKAYTR